MMRSQTSLLFLLLTVVDCNRALAFSFDTMRRRTLFKQIATVCVAGLQVGGCNAFMPFDKPTTAAARNDVAVNGAGTSDAKVAYKSLSLDIDDYGVTVPVAMWFPLGKTSEQDKVLKSLPRQVSGLSYQHRISVSRIGQLLAGWDFIPPFAKKDFELTPTLPFGSVVSGETLTMPTQGPVVYLAHGYLGSRFDLSHLAEELAKQGRNHVVVREWTILLTKVSCSN